MNFFAAVAPGKVACRFDCFRYVMPRGSMWLWKVTNSGNIRWHHHVTKHPLGLAFLRLMASVIVILPLPVSNRLQEALDMSLASKSKSCWAIRFSEKGSCKRCGITGVLWRTIWEPPRTLKAGRTTRRWMQRMHDESRTTQITNFSKFCKISAFCFSLIYDFSVRGLRRPWLQRAAGLASCGEAIFRTMRLRWIERAQCKLQNPRNAGNKKFAQSHGHIYIYV